MPLRGMFQVPPVLRLVEAGTQWRGWMPTHHPPQSLNLETWWWWGLAQWRDTSHSLIKGGACQRVGGAG